MCTFRPRNSSLNLELARSEERILAHLTRSRLRLAKELKEELVMRSECQDAGVKSDQGRSRLDAFGRIGHSSKKIASLWAHVLASGPLPVPAAQELLEEVVEACRSDLLFWDLRIISFSEHL